MKELPGKSGVTLVQWLISAATGFWGLSCFVLNFIVTEIRVVREHNPRHFHEEAVFVKEERKSFLL